MLVLFLFIGSFASVSSLFLRPINFPRLRYPSPSKRFHLAPLAGNYDDLDLGLQRFDKKMIPLQPQQRGRTSHVRDLSFDPLSGPEFMQRLLWATPTENLMSDEEPPPLTEDIDKLSLLEQLERDFARLKAERMVLEKELVDEIEQEDPEPEFRPPPPPVEPQVVVLPPTQPQKSRSRSLYPIKPLRFG